MPSINQSYQDEMREFKAELIKNTCDKGDHNWSYFYDFARCSRCFVDQEDYLKGDKKC